MSIVTPVAVFFARNPDEELSGDDISAKWGVSSCNVRRSLQYAETKGWVTVTKRADETARFGWRYFYTAGPRIRQEIGL